MILLGEKGLLKDLKYNLLFADWCGGLPFKWNNSQNRLEVKTKNEIRLYGFRLFIALLYLIFATIQVVRVFKGAPLIVITHNIMFLSTYMGCICCHYVNYKELSCIVQLFNSFIDFEQRLCLVGRKTGKGHDQKLHQVSGQTLLMIKYLIRLMTSSGISMPILYHLDIIRNPCFPMYVGYWLSDQCDDTNLGTALKPTWTSVEVGIKFGISFISYLMWSLLLVGMVFQISLECIVHGICFRSYVTEFGR